MKKFFSFIIRQTVAIVLAVVLILGLGIFLTMKMPINLLPDINVPMVCIQVIYPGANAQSVEKDVTVELEDGLSSIAGVTDVQSYSYDNVSAVVLSFKYGTDTNKKKSDITTKLNSIALPDGITASVYDIDLNAEALAKFSVVATDSQKEGAMSEAYSGAEELSKKFKAIDGVERVEIKGAPTLNYTLAPYGGLELIAPLIVQAFSYGALDIPLGNITENGKTVQIRNNSDVADEQDIYAMPVTLPAPIVALLSSVKRVMSNFEGCGEGDLLKLKEDLGNGVIAVLRDIDELSADDLGDFATLKTYMNIAAQYDEQTLTDFKGSYYYNEIYKRVDGKSDEELEKLVDDMQEDYGYLSQYLTVDMLKVIRDGKIDVIIAFRHEIESGANYPADGSFYELTADDYYLLETKYVNVYGKGERALYNAEDLTTITPEVHTKLYENIDFALKTSASGLAAISSSKRDAEKNGGEYAPTNSECALLFTGTTLSDQHPIIMSPTFIAFVRAESYEQNIDTLIQKRDEIGYAEDTEITAEQYYDVYCALDLEGIFEFKLSRDLFSFLLDTDAQSLAGDSLVVAVEDICNIKTEEEFSSYVYYANGKLNLVKGTIIEIYKSNGANASAVVRAAKSVCADVEEADIKISLLDDQSEFISDSVYNVLVSMLIGGALAVVVIFLFLKDWRISLIVAVTMPLSVLAALICLSLMGITLNMVSLGGLAVGIGMLVDNSIVVIESITKHRDAGKSAFEAAVDGTCEVGGALIGSTLTTVCVFIPIIFSGGLTGEIFTDLSWAVIFSLAFSLIVAVTVIPTLYYLIGSRKRRVKLRPGVASPTPATAEQALAAKEDAAQDTSALAQPAEDCAVQELSAEADGTVESAEAADKRGKKSKKDKGEKSPKKRRGLSVLTEPRIMNGIQTAYGKILPKLLGKKLIIILLALALFGASVGMLFITGTEFLPSIDKGQIEVNMTYAPGTRLDDIQKDVSGFAEALQNGIPEKGISGIDNINYVSVSVGKNGMLALTDTGIINVQLTTSKNTRKVVDRIRDLAENYDSGGIRESATVREIDGVVASLMSGSDGMSVTVMGEDADKLRVIADAIKERCEKDGFKDVKTSASDTATQYTLLFDRRKMAEMGIDYQTTILTLRIGIASYSACTVVIDGEKYFVNVQFEEGAVASKQTLENFVIGAETDDGTKAVKLKDILIQLEDEEGNPLFEDGAGGYTKTDTGKPAKIIIEEQEACIRRNNGNQMISVSATLPGVDTGTASKRMKGIADEVLSDYEDYEFEESGITSYLKDAFSGLVVALVISFVLLYGVMAIQFGSWLKPLIVMTSIPFSFTGGFLLMVITRTSLNVVSFIGLIMLMGVVVNNAIVMIEKIKQLHDEGMEHYTAVQEACKVRLRPIFMTTLTTILALIPLAVGIGKGSELMQPLGIVVMGGLLLGTLVTLIIVPTVYSAIYRLSAKYPDGKKRKKKQVKSEACGQ